MSQGSWGSRTAGVGSRSRARWARRGVMTVAVLALAGWLVWTLLQPFYHPRAQLVLIAGDIVGIDSRPQAIPADYTLDDLRGMLALEDVLFRGPGAPDRPLVLGGLHQPDQMRELAGQLQSRVTGRGDVLIIYVAAHGVVEDGDAWLIASGADSHLLAGGSYRLSGLLESVEACSAAVKLLVLDAGRLDYDPVRGMLDNDFDAYLAEQVQQSGDASLWVLCSHGAGERGHLAPGLARSVFGHFVAAGLRGAADANRNQEVDLAELASYVDANVRQRVRQNSAGAATQSPCLLWGRGTPLPRALPVLLPVAQSVAGVGDAKALASESATLGNAGTPADAATAQVSQQARREADSFLTSNLSRATPQGRIGNYASDAARRAISKAIGPSRLPLKSPASEQQSPSVSDLTTETGKKGEKVSPGEKQETETSTSAPALSENTQNPKASAVPPVEGKSVKTANPDSKAASSPEVANVPALPPPTHDELALRLEQVWNIRDRFFEAHDARIRPVDAAPHLWRLLEERLLSLDRKLRTGFVRDTAELARHLDEVASQFEVLSGTAASGSPPVAGGAPWLPGRLLAPGKSHSLGQAEFIGRLGGPPAPQEVADVLARLDRLIAAGNRADLARFAAALKPGQEHWIELRQIKNLAAQPDLDWRILQLLLANAREAEKCTAVSMHSPEWCRERVRLADRLRLPVARQILAASNFDRDASLAALNESLAMYRESLADCEAIHAAHCLTHESWHRLPCYLAWHARGGGVSGFSPTLNSVRALLVRLDDLEQLLEAPAAEKIGAVKQAAHGLAAARAEVELASQPLALEELWSMPPAPGKAWRMELLLETPLLPAAARRALALLMPSVDRASASQERPRQPVVSTVANSSTPAENLLRIDDDQFAERSALQHLFWQTALRGVTSPEFNALDEAWRAWNERDSATSATGGQASLAAGREQIQMALEELNRNLPARIERGLEAAQDLSSPGTRPERIARVRAWDRALRIMDARQAAAFASRTPTIALSEAAAFDVLVWLRERSLLASADASGPDVAFFRSAAEDYATLAQSIPRQPPLSAVPSAALEIAGPAHATLTYDAEVQAEFLIRNNRSQARSIWIFAEADEQLVTVATTAQQSVPTWMPEYAVAEAGTGLARTPSGSPALRLAPHEAATISLRIIRQKPALRATHVMIHALSEESSARHDLQLELPPPPDLTLSLRQAVSLWSQGTAAIDLFPFPNRVTPFGLELISGQTTERKVDVELFPILAPPVQAIPLAALNAVDSKRARASMSLGPLVAEVRGLTLLPGIKTPLALAPPEVAPAAKPPAAAAAAQSTAEKPAEAKSPASDKPPPTPLPSGLLTVITDLADQRQTFRLLEISPQRPRRYVRPQVRYRAARERIEISVSPEPQAVLPPGNVRLRGELVEAVPADAVRQLEAVLKPPASTADMHVDAASSPGRVLSLRLSVDDYPRAFYFRVPVSGETSDLPEDADLLAARIVALPKGAIYKPPLASIPVAIEVDAPGAGQKNPALRVEVGIDRNRDRELAGDETLVLNADRQVRAELVGISKAGELQIQTTVRDFTVDVPAAALSNGRANVLVHLVLGDREAWSEPVEIVIDGQPPRVAAIELRPRGVAVIGGELMVSALADDFNLSGVAKVEAAFDTDRSGQFGPMTKAALGALGDDGRWTVKVPTAGLASGAHNVLVRATDRAGNSSEPARANIRLLTAEESAADAKAKNAGDVTGSVVYGTESLAGIKVTLATDTGAPPPTKGQKKKAKTGDSPPPLATAITGADGQFRFPKVAPGKYVIAAEGLVRNKTRRAEERIGFQKPAELQPVTLKLE